MPRNPDFRFTGEKASGCPCQVSREYRVLCTHVALAVLPCVGGTWGESLEKNQIQPNGSTAVYLAHLPHPRKHSHLPSNPTSRVIILIFFCLRKTSFRTSHLIGPRKGQLLQKRRLNWVELQWRRSLQALTVGTGFPSAEGAGGLGLGVAPFLGSWGEEAQEKPGRGRGCAAGSWTSGKGRQSKRGQRSFWSRDRCGRGAPACTHAHVQAHRHAQARARI